MVELNVNFEVVTEYLEQIYPLEVEYGSLATLYGNALREGMITKETYDKAKTYYDKKWMISQR